MRKYSEKFDNWIPESFLLSQKQIESALANVPEQTKKDIWEAQNNVQKFATTHLKTLNEFEIEMAPGVHLGQKNIPISSVGACGSFLVRISDTGL